MASGETGERLVAEARKLLGTRFYHAGRDEHGLDCAGLILCCWHRLGLTDWDFRNYAPGGDREALGAGLVRFCDPVREQEFQAGDLLLFSIKGQPIHVGLYSGENSFIHALETAGSVVEVPLDDRWRSRCVSAWRWREEG
jgi:cell wall-associated NlpC family hydrolase